MNLPPTTVLLIVLIAAVANVVVLLAVFARHRAGRSRQLVDVGGFMSSSYAGDAADDPEPVAGGWLPPASEGWPASRHTWSDSNGYLTPAWPPVAPAPAASPESEVQPFEYPEPTSLEHRGAGGEIGDGVVGSTDASARDADDADDADWDDEDGDDTFEAEADGGADDIEMHQEDEAAMEATRDMTADTPKAAIEPELEPEPEPDPEPEAAGLRLVATPAGRDPLTGMLDASAFEEVMGHEDAREQRYGRPATVIVFELDGLTKLVDRLGPEPGDRIETALGDTIKRLARRADHVARLERGRYAVLLPETDEVAAINYVERIRRACDLWLESGAIAMRLAIGWASTSGDAGLNGAIRLATDRMRLEMRRNARGVGDVTPDLELIEGEGAAEAAAGL